MEGIALLGGLGYQQFLDEYWQQKPLLVRQALPQIEPLFSAEELAGLCLEPDVSSRIIIEQGKTPWQVKYPPFSKQDFLDLPDSHWTLLVNDLELYYPELQGLLQHFRFLPDWRIDDLMVSYAADGGSVGPHIDEYDVFLIQLSGKRRWQLDPLADPRNIIPGLQLRILQDFTAQQDWILEPGDMLYLPPGLAHYGVAQGPCFTGSVGFRSPSQRDLLESWLGKLAESPESARRYGDAGRVWQKQSGQIHHEDLAALKQFLLQAISRDNEFIEQWLGCFLTESKHAEVFEPGAATQEFDATKPYYRSSALRMAWIENGETLELFIAGGHSSWNIELLPLVCWLSEYFEYDIDTLNTMIQRFPEGKELLDYAVRSGFIYTNG